MSKELREDAIAILNTNGKVVIHFKGDESYDYVTIDEIGKNLFKTDALSSTKPYKLRRYEIVDKVFSSLDFYNYTITSVE